MSQVVTNFLWSR